MKGKQIGIIVLLSSVAGLLTYLLAKPLAFKRSAIIRTARSQIGKANPSAYWEDTTGSDKPTLDWCGSFILWALHKNGIAKNWNWEIGKGFIYKLPQTVVPKPGDIAYFTKNQHQALVSSVNANGTITVINGNDSNKNVSESKPFPINQVTAFYSIEELI